MTSSKFSMLFAVSLLLLQGHSIHSGAIVLGMMRFAMLNQLTEKNKTGSLSSTEKEMLETALRWKKSITQQKHVDSENSKALQKNSKEFALLKAEVLSCERQRQSCKPQHQKNSCPKKQWWSR